MSDLDSGEDIFGETGNLSNSDEERDSNFLNHEKTDQTEGDLSPLHFHLFTLIVFHSFFLHSILIRFQNRQKKSNRNQNKETCRKPTAKA